MDGKHMDCACTVCGCVCDDLEVEVAGGKVTQVARHCVLAEPFYASLDQRPAAPYRRRGREVVLEDAITEAVHLLKRAQSPLVFGLSRSSTDGQRAAVALADALGACVDTSASVCHGPSIMAIQQVGESTSTLGEIRHRADLVIFWGADPAQSHPRHFERYSLEPKGMFVPGGRDDRFVVVVDSDRSQTSELADMFVQVPEGREFEMIWSIRSLLQGLPIAMSDYHGVDPEQLQELIDRMKNAQYGVFFFGLGLAQRGIGHANVEALLQLVKDLNAFTRFTARRLRIPGDVTGADLVVCWQTGFPFAVNLARGYPRYNPGEYTASELLSRREVDACVLVGSEMVRQLPEAARHHLRRVPTIVLDYPNAAADFEPTIHITTGIYGIHASGTAYRMDEVPIPLRQLIAAPYPTDGEVLRAILRGLRSAGSASLDGVTTGTAR